MLTKTKLTYSRYMELPDTDPYEHEMIAGEEFVSPSLNYRHQWIRDRLCALLWVFVNERRLGAVVSPVDLYYSEEDYVSPDISFFNLAQHGQLLDQQKIRLAPPLAIEVLSKSSVKWDREDKRGFYERFGVQEYWIVDPFEETIQVIDLAMGASSMSDPAVSKVLGGFSVRWEQVFEG
ncbi:MAG: Uma2 family endonuclease [Chloroflexota bacterium]